MKGGEHFILAIRRDLSKEVKFKVRERMTKSRGKNIPGRKKNIDEAGDGVTIIYCWVTTLPQI